MSESTHVDDESTDTSLRVLTIVSYAATKQELDEDETVPARELYSSNTHICKDRFARHSHGYYIASAKYGLVHSETEIGWYDQTLSNMSDEEVEWWAEDVAGDLAHIVVDDNFDAVVLIGGKDYVEPLAPYFEGIDAAILTPWQTCDDVTGVGRGMSWCNDEAHWPVNADAIEEIGEVVTEA
jgi:hypothetical protein